MKIFAISDLHLSFNADKPMEVFGKAWENYVDVVAANWKARVSEEDAVLLAGDLSWAMKLEDALADINFVAGLPGHKVIIKGNHDFWWSSISRLRAALPSNFFAIQNDSVRVGDFLICGTRGWTVPEAGEVSEEDRKIYAREVLRLKLSLSHMQSQRKEGDKVICMMHFPPFNSKREPSDFTELIYENKVDCAIYGHLHGKDCKADKKVVISGVPYYLTSVDLVGTELVRIF